jgi:hypothetical protein
VELNQWIDSIGGVTSAGKLSLAALAAVASLLEEEPRTVSSWYRKERRPSFAAGMNILSKSGGAVDWNGIYAPFALELMKNRVKNAGA